jgi:hypothetical protein
LKGGDKVIPLYNEPRTNPFIPNEEKKIHQSFISDKIDKTAIKTGQIDAMSGAPLLSQDPRSKMNPVVNLQVYQPPPPPKPKTIDPSTFFANTYLPTPYYPPQMNYGFMPRDPPIMPVINTYNISASGPMVDHTRLNMIYENVLPGKEMNATAITINERLTLHNYMRSTMFPRGDGSNINLYGSGKDSLVSHIKFMDLNPYNSYKLSNNPYKGLPNDMLLYRSCYPIRHNMEFRTVSCARGALGMNIRIYKMTDGEFSVNSQKDKKILDYDIWREVGYYEYVREQIIKKKQSPNFISLFGYYVTENSQIDFDKLRSLKGEGIRQEVRYVFQNPDKKLLVANPNNYSGKTLVSLTEAPLYSLMGWASKVYTVEGISKKMINTGYHSEAVWHSIMFQIMVALYVMQKHGIIFNNFHPETNIFIKDLNLNTNATTYWKYKIDGLDYYIPNYGYLVMFDSSYQDIVQTKGVLGVSPLKFKISGKLFEDNLKQEEIQQRIFEMFKRTFDPNIFNDSFFNDDGCKPPPEIYALFENISHDINTKPGYDIGKYIVKYMSKFMHNRIGSYLKETEIKDNIRREDTKDFTKGQLIVFEELANTYKFVAFLRKENNGIAVILTKDDKDSKELLEKRVSITTLYGFSKVEPIVQNFKPNESNLNEDELLETYVC